MKKYIFFLILFCYKEIFAATPIVNAPDFTFISTYLNEAGQLLNQLQNAQNEYEQIKSLKGLQQIEAAGQAICDFNSENGADMMGNYVNNINNGICMQFSNIMDNINQLENNFNDVKSLLSGFTLNPVAASVSIQQSSATILNNVQATLAQINILQSQIEQKALAEEKLTNQTLTNISNIFGNQQY